jgi:NADH-quinone oxidoreductase subunit N
MIMPVLTSADLMPLLPEIVVVVGAFALLMLDLFLDRAPPCHATASRIAVLVVATVMIAAAWAGRARCSTACSCATPPPT